MLLIIPPPDQVHFMVPLSLQVYTLPYTPDSDGSCRNKTAEYYNPDVNLCCSKCTSGKVWSWILMKLRREDILRILALDMITSNITILLQHSVGSVKCTCTEMITVNYTCISLQGHAGKLYAALPQTRRVNHVLVTSTAGPLITSQNASDVPSVQQVGGLYYSSDSATLIRVSSLTSIWFLYAWRQRPEVCPEVLQHHQDPVCVPDWDVLHTGPTPGL